MRHITTLFLLLILNAILVVLLSTIGVFVNQLVPHTVSLFYWSTAFLLLTLVLLKLFEIKIPPFRFSRSLLHLIPLGLICGLYFWLIGESTPGFSLLIIALIDPLIVSIGEELNYRLLIQKVALKSLQLKQALLLQAVFFALMHFNFAPHFFLSYLGFGIICGYLAHKKTIYHAIVFHYATNVVLTILAL